MGCRLSDSKHLQLPTLKIVILGLDGCGKTTTLSRLQKNQSPVCTPTIGVNTVSVVYNSLLRLVIFDVSGHARSLWSAYFDSLDACVFVVDCSDTARIEQTRNQLHRVDAALTNVQMLIFLNKQDVAEERNQKYWLDQLNVGQLKNDTVVERGSAKTGQGIRTAFGKLLKLLEKRFTGEVQQHEQQNVNKQNLQKLERAPHVASK